LSQDIVILEELRRQIRQSQVGRSLLDATLVRLTLSDQFTSIGELVARMNGGAPPQKKNSPEVTRPAPVHTPPPAYRAAAPTAPAPVAPAPKAPEPVPVAESTTTENTDDGDDDLPAVGRVWEGPRESLATLMARQKAAGNSAPAQKPETSNVEPVNVGNLPAAWKAMLGLLAEQGPALSGLLMHGELARVSEGFAVIRYAKQHETFVKMLERNNKKDVVRDALSKVLDQQVGVRFELTDANVTPTPPPQPKAAASAPAVPTSQPRPSTPAPAARPAPSAPPPPEANTSIRVTDELRSQLYKNEPLIKAVVDKFGGNIIKIEE